MQFRVDFHIHSCLSPCGALEMAPDAIVQHAQAAGLNGLAITDHNSALNAPAFAEVCAAAGMHCLLGMEITTQEEVHVLCLCERLEDIMAVHDVIDAHLPDVPYDPERFGDQVYVNAANEIEGMVDNYLISAVDLGLDDVGALIHRHHGLFVPAHVNRDSFSMTSQLGFVPPASYDAVEVTGRYDQAKDDCQLQQRFAVVVGSDAHYLHQIGTVHNEMELNAWSIESIRAELQSHPGYRF